MGRPGVRVVSQRRIRAAWVGVLHVVEFGGNIGLHGKMDALIDGFYDAKADVHAGRTLRGVGMTPEGIENNPVMYELVMELPWREHRFTRDEWLKGYVYARYGVEDEALQQVWDLLGNGIYNSPKEKYNRERMSLYSALVRGWMYIRYPVGRR